MLGNVTAIVVNYKTKELTKTCVNSFVERYPDTALLLIDNRSQDDSAIFCRQFALAHLSVHLVSMPINMGHGPALHHGTFMVNTRYFFTLDSDCTLVGDGLLESMLEQFGANDNLYTSGWLRHVNKDGVAVLGDFDRSKFLPYVHPYAAMFDRWKYVRLPPFAYHGAPCYHNMLGARNAGYDLANFDLECYVRHEVAGTRRMWGGAWDIRDKPPTREWKSRDKYPI